MIDKIRILLADDHAVLRSGLKLLLNSQDDFVVIGEAPTGLSAITLAEELQPDLSMENRNIYNKRLRMALLGIF